MSALAAMFTAYRVAAVPSPPPDEVRRTAAEVFARPEFNSGAGVSNWLIRAVQDFFAWLGSLSTVNPALFWVIFIGCLLLLALLLTHIVYTVVRAIRFGGNAARRRQEREAAERRQRLSATFRSEATAAAGRGDFTEAIRCLFLSLVYRFDEQGRVGFPKSRTNHEYLALLDADRPVRDELAVFVDTLDDHWYGQQPAGRERFDDCRARYERLLAAG
jgi:hypothetical protein